MTLADKALQAPATTGWPAPALAQDDCRALFRWFAIRLDARRRVREACAEIAATRTEDKALYLLIPFAVAVITWSPMP